MSQVISIKWGIEGLCSICLLEKSTRSYCCYYSYTTHSLTATTTTLTTTIYNLLLMALETKGLLQLLSRYNSKKVQ